MNKKLVIIYILLAAVALLFCGPSFAVSAPPDSAKPADAAAPAESPAKADEKRAASEEPPDTTEPPPGEELTTGGVGKGALLSPLLGESFQTDLATGSATANIPIVVPPGRKNMQPSLALSYSSNNPNGVLGVGWALSTSCIQRSTKKGIPKYDNTDTFVFASSGSSGEFVLVDPARGEYRQKIETAFMKYVLADNVWTVYDKTGTCYTFGSLLDSRLSDSGSSKVFAWFLDKVEDVYGNAVLFTYTKDAGQIYLSRVEYTANSAISPPLAADKTVEFIYETGRADITDSYRSGWKIETAKKLKEIQIKVDGTLVWRYVLSYELSVDTKRSLLSSVTLFDAAGIPLPAKRFKYQAIE